MSLKKITDYMEAQEQGTRSSSMWATLGDHEAEGSEENDNAEDAGHWRGIVRQRTAKRIATWKRKVKMRTGKKKMSRTVRR